jgi:hypothetical protein
MWGVTYIYVIYRVYIGYIESVSFCDVFVYNCSVYYVRVCCLCVLLYKASSVVLVCLVSTCFSFFCFSFWSFLTIDKKPI